MTGPAIEVHDLVVRYRKTVAVNRISFEARAGQIVALLGPNGAGKTSTVETLEGYRRPTVGTVRVLGLDPHHDHKALTKRMGVMLQKGGIYPSMSPREAVRLFAHYYDESEEPEGLLYRVGLVSVASTPWRQLSGGEQQRLSLALALIGRPWVAFLDEPTAGVDPQGRLAIREVIKDLRSAGACVLLTTHEMQEAERLADRIIILDRGEIVADGSPSELTAKEGGKEVRFGAPAGLDIVALAVVLAAAVDEVQPGEYVVHAEGTPAIIAALAAWLAERNLAMADLRAGRQRLEDVFLRLTGGSNAPNGAAAPTATTTIVAPTAAAAGPAGTDETAPSTVASVAPGAEATAVATATGSDPGAPAAPNAAATATSHATTPAAPNAPAAATSHPTTPAARTYGATPVENVPATPSRVAEDPAGSSADASAESPAEEIAGPSDGAAGGPAPLPISGTHDRVTGAGTAPRPVSGARDRGRAIGGRRRRRVGAGGRGAGATEPTPNDGRSEGDE